MLVLEAYPGEALSAKIAVPRPEDQYCFANQFTLLNTVDVRISVRGIRAGS